MEKYFMLRNNIIYFVVGCYLTNAFLGVVTIIISLFCHISLLTSSIPFLLFSILLIGMLSPLEKFLQSFVQNLT